MPEGCLRITPAKSVAIKVTIALRNQALILVKADFKCRLRVHRAKLITGLRPALTCTLQESTPKVSQEEMERLEEHAEVRHDEVEADQRPREAGEEEREGSTCSTPTFVPEHSKPQVHSLDYQSKIETFKLKLQIIKNITYTLIINFQYPFIYCTH